MRSSAEITGAGPRPDDPRPTPFERLRRPGIAASDDEMHADDLGSVDEPAVARSPDVDEIVDEVGVIKRRTDATLVVGRIEIQDEVEVAGHARFRVDGEGPRSGHKVTDGQSIEPIEDLAFGQLTVRIDRCCSRC